MSAINVGGLSTKTEREIYADKDVAAAYADARPEYPQELIEKLVAQFDREKSSNGTPIHFALDVACGPGTLTRQLSTHCKKILAIDISAAQINEAKKNQTESNIEYRVSECYNIDVESGSVDLITVATALHRFEDIPRFMNEVDRCLKPGGIFAFFGLMEDKTDHIPNKIVWKYAYGKEWLNQYWTKTANLIIVDRYESLQLPYSNIERFEIHFRLSFTLEQLRTLFKSYEAYNNLLEVDKKKAQETLDSLSAEISATLSPQTNGPEEPVSTFEIDHEVFGAICRKPL